MIRRFCDCCGTEIESRNKLGPAHYGGNEELIGGTCVALFAPKHFEVTVFISVSNNRSWWDHLKAPVAEDICVYCVLDAIARLDDRAKEA